MSQKAGLKNSPVPAERASLLPPLVFRQSVLIAHAKKLWIILKYIS
jgi:hypothetical protein